MSNSQTPRLTKPEELGKGQIKGKGRRVARVGGETKGASHDLFPGANQIITGNHFLMISQRISVCKSSVQCGEINAKDGFTI